MGYCQEGGGGWSQVDGKCKVGLGLCSYSGSQPCSSGGMKEPLAVHVCLHSSEPPPEAPPKGVQNQVDPLGLLLCYPGLRGKICPVPRRSSHKFTLDAMQANSDRPTQLTFSLVPPLVKEGGACASLLLGAVAQKCFIAYCDTPWLV